MGLKKCAKGRWSSFVRFRLHILVRRSRVKSMAGDINDFASPPFKLKLTFRVVAL